MSLDSSFGQLVRSTDSRGPRDVMLEDEIQKNSGYGSYDSLKDGLNGKFNASAEQIYYEPQAKSAYESVFIDSEPGRTVFNDLDEGQNIDRTPDVSNTAQFLLNPQKAAPGADQIHDRAVDCKMDTEDKMAKCEQDWDDHQQRAAQYLEQGARERGGELGIENPGMVKQQMLPQSGSTKTDALVGLGTMAMPKAAAADGGLDIIAAVKGSELTRDQKKALIKETCSKAQECTAPRDTLADRSSSGGSAPSAAPDQTALNLARLTEAKMEKLLTERVEDQPEYEALAKVDHDLTFVLDVNHPTFAREYGNSNVGEKIVSHAISGDAPMQGIVIEASTVQASFDASHAQLCGACVGGYQGFNQSAQDLAGKMDLNSVATIVELNNNSAGSPVYDKAQSALHNYAQNAMS